MALINTQLNNYIFQFILIITFVTIKAENFYKPTPDYIGAINLSYENAIWQCDRLECPVNTHGCRLEIVNDVNKKIDIIHTSSCFDTKNSTIDSLAWKETQEPNIEKKIDIFIETFVGAETVSSQGYGSSGQNAKAIVAIDDWKKFQKTAAEQKKQVDESMMTKLNDN